MWLLNVKRVYILRIVKMLSIFIIIRSCGIVYLFAIVVVYILYNLKKYPTSSYTQVYTAHVKPHVIGHFLIPIMWT